MGEVVYEVYRVGFCEVETGLAVLGEELIKSCMKGKR